MKLIAPGWNLGNTLESDTYEENWGNPHTSQEIINGVLNKGYKSIRIPIKWDNNYTDSSSYTIDNNLLNRVKEIVDYIYNKNKFVIINVHHNAIQKLYNNDNKEKIKTELNSIWKQISNYFINYDDKLIFEVINEPRNGDSDWIGNSELYNIVNECNEIGLQAIRNTGGNNKYRFVILPTNSKCF